MGIGVSIFLLALGAILTFAVTFQIAGLDINVVGIILMVCGAIGLVLTLVMANSARRPPPAGDPGYRDDRPTY